MNSLDTNVLVRFLMGDDQTQSQKVYQLFKIAEKSKEEFYVPILVFIKMIWVIESAYQIKRNKILTSLKDLTQMPILQFEHYEAIQSFILDAQTNNYDLSDLLIAYCANQKKCLICFNF